MATIVKLLVEGGKMTPGPAVAQKLGPMGVNLGKVISDVNEKTKDFSGMNVPVILNIDTDTKEYEIDVLLPPTSELLKKEAGAQKASGDRVNFSAGNLAMEQIISVSLQKHESMLSRDFKSSVKSVLGTSQSLGILVESQNVGDVMVDFLEGKYDAIVDSKKSEADPEKAKELKEYFDKINRAQMAKKAELEAESSSK